MDAAIVDHLAAGHVRRGDYVNNPRTNAIFGTCSWNYYREAASLVAATTTNTEFFVFSDDPDTVEADLTLPGPSRIVRVAQAGQDWVDLGLMQRCRHFIIANSSFSWWAAWLGTAADKIVVAPRQWFRDYRAETRDLCPAGWLRV